MRPLVTRNANMLLRMKNGIALSKKRCAVIGRWALDRATPTSLIGSLSIELRAGARFPPDYGVEDEPEHRHRLVLHLFCILHEYEIEARLEDRRAVLRRKSDDRPVRAPLGVDRISVLAHEPVGPI